MKRRPININPFSIQLPIGALVSITHRLSGILVFLLIPMILWAFQQSLQSPEQFAQIKSCFTGDGSKLVLLVTLAAVVFHVLAGIRHLLMDIHIGDSKQSGRIGAYAVFMLSAIVVIAAVWYGWG